MFYQAKSFLRSCTPVHYQCNNQSRRRTGAVEKATYRKSVLLVGRSSSWRELRGVGWSELQAVALNSPRLRHIGQQGLQCHVLLLSKVVPCHQASNKLHLELQGKQSRVTRTSL